MLRLFGIRRYTISVCFETFLIVFNHRGIVLIICHLSFKELPPTFGSDINSILLLLYAVATLVFLKLSNGQQITVCSKCSASASICLQKICVSVTMFPFSSTIWM